MNYMVRSVSLVIVMSLGVLSIGCSDTEKANEEKPVIPAETVEMGKKLPYAILLNGDGSVDLSVVEESGAKIVDVSESDFPIASKIKRVETITLVTYEGSCEVLVKTKTGYKKVVITNEALCASIKP